jgi:acyl-CoA hydrolase
MPVRLSAMPGLLAGRLRPDVAVVGAVRVAAGEVGGGAGWRLVGGPGYALAAVRAARVGVVIERWPDAVAGQPGGFPALGPELPPCRVLAVVDRAEPPDPGPERRATPALATIGRAVASLIPDGATIQWGPGAVGPAVVDAIDRTVRVWSGLVTEELAGLARRGLLAAPADTAYLWGGPDLHDMVAAGEVRFAEVAQTHDITAISRTERFVAINTGLQVGLDGAVNVEVVGGRLVSGPGGHPDFAAGAARSPGGLSVVALTACSSGRSNIVLRPEVVSTPRSDVDVVVTEHGVADLRGCPDEERARLLVAIAAPEHRGRLEADIAAGPTGRRDDGRLNG